MNILSILVVNTFGNGCVEDKTEHNGSGAGPIIF
jgi:hypothetical protein